MKTHLLSARVWVVFVAVVLIGAACVPIPDSQPLPNAETPGAVVSPLQPTPEPTSSGAPSTTVVLTPTLAAPSPTPTPSTTPVPTLTATPTATPLPTVVGPIWEWVSSALKDSPTLAPEDPARYTFQLLGDGNALIQADCNFGAGSYTESADTLSFPAIGATKVACPPDSLDSAFLAQLRYIESFRFEDGELVLTLKDGAGSMRLRPASTDEVAGAAVTAAPASARASDRPPPPTSIPTDTPAPAAALPALTATPAPSPSPQRTATPPTMLGTPVALSTPTGAVNVLPALNGTGWMLVSLIANDQAIPPAGSTPVTVQVDRDGERLSGFTGCNGYRATLSTGANRATVLDPALTTQTTCAANLLVQEVEFIDALLRTRSYELRGNELILVGVAGNSLMVLVRK